MESPGAATVSPVDIIPVAEDMGLIVDLGRWILRKACMGMHEMA